MTDSLTESDIDRIYGRITEQVDLSKIKTKSEFKKEIMKNPRTKKWNTKLNDFFWDIYKGKEEVLEEVLEIEEIPAIPRDRLTPIEKRRKTLEIKKLMINIRASSRQKAYTRRKGRKWVDVEIEFSQTLKKDGLTYKQIAEQLNRTKSSVSTKLNRVNKK